MKYKLLRFSLLSILAMLLGTVYADFQKVAKAAEPGTFRDIKLNLTDETWKNKLPSSGAAATVYITVTEDGTIGTTENADEAAATMTGYWHSTTYGGHNVTLSVPVQGCVKITYGMNDYGSDVTITDSDNQEVAKLNNKDTTGKWTSDKPDQRIAVAYYRTNQPTTLTFSQCQYVGYIAVEAIAETDLPAEVTTFNVTFAAGEGTGTAPAAVEVNAGGKITMPKNYTLYKEGATQTGWSDGTNTYVVGAEVTPEGDMTLTAVFTANEVSLSDRTSPVTLTYALDGYNDNPKYKFEGNSGIIVTQATIGDKTIDVKADVDATQGKFAYNGSGWHQVNTGTKVTVPSCKGASFTVKTYNNGNNLTFGNTAAEANTDPASYTTTATNETLVIEQTGNGYWNLLTVTLPVVEQGEEPGEEPGDEPVAEDITATWNFAGNCASLDSKANNGAYTAETMASNVEGIEMAIEYNGGVIKNNDNSYQVTNGVVMKIPVKNAGDLITVKGYQDYSHYTIGNSTVELKNTNEYKAKKSDADAGYVAVTSIDGNNYYVSITVTQYAPKGNVTLDNEAVTVTFPFDQGTEGQTATFSKSDYFLNSKVAVGSNFVIEDKNSASGFDQTRLKSQSKESKNGETNLIQFLFTPKPGFTFTPTKVSFKATRYGTDGGKMTISWQNPDMTLTELATGQTPNRDNGNDANKQPTGIPYSEYSYDITGATPAEGSCGLALNIHSLDAGKRYGFANIVIEGTLSGTEKEVPILASFKVNGNEYAVEDVFGEAYDATLELPKAEQMVGSDNPLTEVMPLSGEVGTITYEGTATACKVTIPMTSGETLMSYVLNVVQKPDFTLSYFDTDGTLMGTQTVEKDAQIGAFAVDYTTANAPEGEKVRGWFKTSVYGEKFTVNDVITANTNLYAVSTEIEEASTSKKYNFDLTQKNFDPADHEAFSTENGYFHDATHGWAFKNGDKIELLVGPKASISIGLCRYGYGTSIVATDANGNTIATVDGMSKSQTDGEVVGFNYEGEAGTLTLTIAATGEMYLHNVKIVNTAETSFENDGQWYFVKAGDTNSLIEVIEAVNGINASKTSERSFIFMPNGTYDLKQTVLTTISGHNISLIGESQDGVIIKNAPHYTNEGIDKTATLVNTGTNNYFQDITIQNALEYYKAQEEGGMSGARAVAFWDKGTGTICKNVTLLSYQDTYYTNNPNGEYYWETSDIHGTVDFFCGEGTLFVENSTITVEKRYLTKNGGCTITAPSTVAGKDFGYVFNDCKIENNATSYNLGRAWNNEPKCAFINTTLNDDKMQESRWATAAINTGIVAKEFVEYGTTGAPTSKKVTFTDKGGNGGVQQEIILSAEQAANYTLAKVFPEWTPAAYATQTEAPAANYADGKVTWTPANNGAIAYMIEKNGEYAGITTDASFDITIDAEKDALTIRAANSRGGFGPAAEVAMIPTAITNVKATANDDAIYTLQGVRVEKVNRGLYIVNGKKVIK